MRFTLAQLEAFYWVVKQGTVRDAALRLNLSQPSVSLRIRELEIALSTTLFERSRKGMQLTSSGGELMERALIILGEAEQISNLAKSPDSVRGVVRIGMPEFFAVRCLPILLKSLELAHPYLRVELHISTSAELVTAVRERRTDLAFVIDPIRAQNLQMVPLGYLERSWVGGRGTKLKQPVKADDIRHMAILTIPPVELSETTVGRWFQSGGALPSHLVPCNSVYVIAQLIKRNIGLGILPLPLIEAENTDGNLCILESDPPVMPSMSYAVYWLDATSPTIDAVIYQTRRALSETGFLKLL